MNVPVNYLAVFLAAVASMVVGFAWYSPFLLGNPWMKLMGYTKEGMMKKQKEMGMWYGIAFVASLVTAYVMAHVMALSIAYFHYAPIMTGFTTAFFMWLGFVAPVQLTDVIFGGKKLELFAINTGYQFASLMAMGLVLGLL